jgi:DNA-binding XRE family transcriptional regulator
MHPAQQKEHLADSRRNLKGGEEMTLGERMLSYRAEHKLSQRQLGEIIGESINTIHRCERGDNMHLANSMRLEKKMSFLEEKENA